MPELMMGNAVPVAPDKTRTTITMPKALLERVRLYRFARHYESLSAALAALVEQALDHDQAEREGRESADKP